MIDTIELVLRAVAVGFLVWGGYLSLAAKDRRKSDAPNTAHRRRRGDGLPNSEPVRLSSESEAVGRLSDFSIGFRGLANGDFKRAA